MLTVKQLRKVQTEEELESLGIGRVCVEISHRGGGLGFYSEDVARHFNVERYYLPNKFGAGCNYMGGGIRGSIFPSTFSKEVTGKTAKLLTELTEACKRVYENIENETGLNDDNYDDGDTNWDSIATKAVRKSGKISAY